MRQPLDEWGGRGELTWAARSRLRYEEAAETKRVQQDGKGKKEGARLGSVMPSARQGERGEHARAGLVE